MPPLSRILTAKLFSCAGGKEESVQITLHGDSMSLKCSKVDAITEDGNGSRKIKQWALRISPYFLPLSVISGGLFGFNNSIV